MYGWEGRVEEFELKAFSTTTYPVDNFRPHMQNLMNSSTNQLKQYPQNLLSARIAYLGKEIWILQTTTQYLSTPWGGHSRKTFCGLRFDSSFSQLRTSFGPPAQWSRLCLTEHSKQKARNIGSRVAAPRCT